MNINFNVTEQNLNNLRKLADQHKNQRALNFKNGMLKQTHDKNYQKTYHISLKN